MKNGKKAVSAAGLLVIIFLSSCMRDPYVAPTKRLTEDFEKEVFIINSLAETISVIDGSADGDLYDDVLITGSWPNYCLVYDGRIYLVNSGDNNITVYDESSFEYSGEIYLGAGSNPWMIIHKPGTAEAYVPCFASGDVAVIDLEALTVETRISAGAGPEGGAWQDGKVYVGNTAWNYQTFSYNEGTVSIIDDTEHEIIKTLEVGINPQSIIAFPALNEVHVICTGKNGGPGSDDGQVVVINTLTDTVSAVIDTGGSPVGGSGCIDSLTGTVYLSGIGGIISYNYNTKTVIHNSENYLLELENTVNDFYAGLTVDESARYLYISFFTGDKVLKVNLDSYSIIKEFEGADGPQSLFLYAE